MKKKGIVKYFNYAKGFGFIWEIVTEKQYFVHFSSSNDEIGEGDFVEFNTKEIEKKSHAIEVKVLRKNEFSHCISSNGELDIKRINERLNERWKIMKNEL